jgi:hypothetical protein
VPPADAPPRITVNLLQDEEALDEAVLALVAEIDPDLGSDTGILVDELRSQLHPDGGELLDHLIALLKQRGEDLVLGVVRRVLREVRLDAAGIEIGAPRDLPVLHEMVLADDDALAAAVDRVLRASPQYMGSRRQIIDAEQRLRSAVSQAAWRIYLDLDAARGESVVHGQDVLIRWAYAEGLRAAAAPRTPGCQGQRCG